jgi:ribosome-associated heat shock protein Hsp15
VTEPPPAPALAKGPETQRVDRWLWFARFLKTRTLAAKLVENGKIRLTLSASETESVRIDKPSHAIRIGDTLTFPLGRNIRVVRVANTGVRRGPAPEARQLYEDLNPPSLKPPEVDPQTASPAVRPPGAGRPTKKERRALEKLDPQK